MEITRAIPGQLSPASSWMFPMSPPMSLACAAAIESQVLPTTTVYVLNVRPTQYFLGVGTGVGGFGVGGVGGGTGVGGKVAQWLAPCLDT